MKRVTKQKWLKALRSGEYQQAKGVLCYGNGYCCLGVLCKITGNSENRDMNGNWPATKDDDLTTPLPFMGLSTLMQHNLANLNDKGASFKEIATYISRNVKTED